MSRRVRSVATALLVLGSLAYGGLFAANSLVRVRTFSADSMNYVDVARHMAAGDGLVQSTGGFNQPFYLSGNLDLPSAFTAQPPGYPLAIAFLSRLGMDAADAALVVSMLAYAAILLLVFLLGRRIAGAGAGVASLAIALLFQPLTHHGRAALSECLAVAVVLLFLLLLDRFLERPPGLAGWLDVLPPLGLGLLAGGAFGVRYALWPLPLVGLAALLLRFGFVGRYRAEASSGEGSPAATKEVKEMTSAGGPSGPHPGRSRGAAGLRNCAAFALGALAPTAAILARNLALEGHLLPPSMPATSSFGENAVRTLEAVAGGWRSTVLGDWTDAVVLLLVLAAILAPAIRERVRAWREGRAVDGRAPLSGFQGRGRLPLLIGFWCVLYLGTLVWRSSTANLDPVGVRLVLPATAALLPLTGALMVWSLSRAHRAAWLPVVLITIALGAALTREAIVWARSPDARALEFRSERQQWLRDHTGPGDLVIGGGTMDYPFLFPGRFAISYVGLPYTEVLTYPDLQRIASRHCPAFDRLLLVVRPTVELGGGRSEEDPTDWLGPFIADARAGRHEGYPLLQPLATLNEARVYRIACPN